MALFVTFVFLFAILTLVNTQSISTKIPSTHQYVGCYTDSISTRTLAKLANQGDTMTEESCISFCNTNGYPYAGVEYSKECFCDYAIASTGVKSPETDCNMACGGDATELCGGSNRLNIFKNKSFTGIGHNPGPPGWGFLGCYTDSASARTLPYAGQVTGSMTVAGCTAACKAGGYAYAGLEYGQECYCGTTLASSAAAPDGLTGCNMACKGNNTEFCGGSNRLDVYGVKTSSSTTLVTTTTTLKTSTLTTTSLVTTTTTKPASTTTAVVTTTTTKPVTTTTTVPPTTTTTTTTIRTTVASTTTTSAAGPTLPAGWSYRGCFIDNANGRILKPGTNSASLTIESCVAQCQAGGYSAAGMEYSTECYCGNAISNGGKLATSDTECNMVCGGKAGETCGGASRMSVYATGNLVTYGVPVAKTSGLPGSWKYGGCLSDGAQQRVLPYQIDMVNNLTVANCLNLCAQYGYGAAGLEYGQQCFCGDDADRVNRGATYVAATRCDTPCPGDPETLCGGGLVMNYYSWDNFNSWAQATGDAAGQYQFLIGGPVIPLITNVQLNGKILFTEKHGTSYQPNSTGAWELDVTKVNDYNSAWRELQGIKTDVFCSAGLMLPDKAGRTINIGGWSVESLYGVRFYTADGFDGSRGKNTWQENVAEVSLLQGRWYPTAMQMVNGSILVVGGEDGSNGTPVPSLEVIPRPPGVTRTVFADWLNRTDPYNLYPFLTVLPSGNIAVFYYNEARILDEKTFATVRTLPNIPGAVNNFNGGRTYPLEGTSMLLPQYAPYTDPLGVLICGGSTPFGGVALDNCVSIQPEVVGQNWTIERMPSRRVISCMVGLPDGTYLILNGARQGVAGFGLATDGNHEAVLYDPTKPVNKRYTKMANTTIDRLYHSEAILLMDGRVLVSGSDPEDNPATATVVHAQEYRVEVFIPPYLMGNRAASRPDFIFQNDTSTTNNLGYGQTFKIYVNKAVGKISLNAATSSTHGNSMGQRTIFPAFTCATGGGSGAYTNVCTITTPPNGYITGGPGWYMVFVMDANGTPSVAKWVRIGGDPAKLGNWPNFSDFTLPGV